MDLRKSNALKHPDFTQNHTTKDCSFSCHPKCILTLLQHSQQTCNALFSSWISAKEKAKNALDQLMQLLKTSPDVRRKLLMRACIIGLPALTRSCVWIGRVWEQSNYLPSPTPWFQVGVDLGSASWLVTRLGSGCESAHCENRPCLVVGRFSIDMPFTGMASSRYWIIYLSINDSASWMVR